MLTGSEAAYSKATQTHLLPEPHPRPRRRSTHLTPLPCTRATQAGKGKDSAAPCPMLNAEILGRGDPADQALLPSAASGPLTVPKALDPATLGIWPLLQRACSSPHPLIMCPPELSSEAAGCHQCTSHTQIVSSQIAVSVAST